MHRVGGSQNYTAPGSEGQADQAVAGDFQAGVAFRSDLHDPALAGEGGRHVQISGGVKRQALGAPQAAKKFVNRSLRIDSVHAIKARRGGPGHK